MKKAIVMTLCAAMAVGMIGSVSTVYAADADIASDDAIKKAADEGWEIAVVPKDSKRANGGVDDAGAFPLGFASHVQ